MAPKPSSFRGGSKTKARLITIYTLTFSDLPNGLYKCVQLSLIESPTFMTNNAKYLSVIMIRIRTSCNLPKSLRSPFLPLVMPDPLPQPIYFFLLDPGLRAIPNLSEFIHSGHGHLQDYSTSLTTDGVARPPQTPATLQFMTAPPSLAAPSLSFMLFDPTSTLYQHNNEHRFSRCRHSLVSLVAQPGAERDSHTRPFLSCALNSPPPHLGPIPSLRYHKVRALSVLPCVTHPTTPPTNSMFIVSHNRLRY